MLVQRIMEIRSGFRGVIAVVLCLLMAKQLTYIKATSRE